MFLIGGERALSVWMALDLAAILEGRTLVIYFAGCNAPGSSHKIAAAEQKVSGQADSTQKTNSTQNGSTPIKNDTTGVKDIPVNEYLLKELKPVRENFKRINTINHWTSVIEKDLANTPELGEAKFYYLQNNLEKISEINYGETFQQRNVYYFLNKQLSFVLEKKYSYNRPIYYDSAAMKENNDTEAFDFSRSVIEETRSYFFNNRLVHQLNNQDCGSPFADDYLKSEQKRIDSACKNLLLLVKRK